MQLLTRLFSFRGTLSRGEYWALTLVVWLAFCCVRSAVDLWLEPSIGQYALIAASLAMLWLEAALSARRLHDRAHSGRWLLIALVPVIGPVWLLAQMALAGRSNYSRLAMRSSLALRFRAFR